MRRDVTAVGDSPKFASATLLPWRGMNFFQARAYFPGLGEIDLLASPPLPQARQSFGGAEDFMGVQSFSFGGAVLFPFANRIRGKMLPDGRTLETMVAGRKVLLPADWHGKAPGAEKCAMHGLILESVMDVVEADSYHVKAALDCGNFGGYWLSRALVEVEAELRAQALAFSLLVTNTGNEVLPVGIGWHPYFALPSKRREQARVHVPARKRALVNNYDDVFPTGELVPVADTPYDFTAPDGAALGSLYLDDSFVDLEKTREGNTVVRILDPAAHYEVRLTAFSPHIRALQVYSPSGKSFVVLEPQFNWADPFSAVWPAGTDTGMVMLAPSEQVSWAIQWELFVI
ncbi:MAG: aldose 1-epimerase [Acidobacteriota bacterium]|nr:aldose 1-epimerase [Acidobacteriota bacterium]